MRCAFRPDSRSIHMKPTPKPHIYAAGLFLVSAVFCTPLSATPDSESAPRKGVLQALFGKKPEQTSNAARSAGKSRVPAATRKGKGSRQCKLFRRNRSALTLTLAQASRRNDPPALRPKKPLFAKKAAKPDLGGKTNGSVKWSRLVQGNGSNSSVIVDINRQKAFLLVDKRIALTSPVSTGRPGKPTPRGTFSMRDRVRTGKISTIYHTVLPYWIRIGNSACGFHAGRVPGYPASAGCVRLPSDMARLIFDHTGVGTRVKICDSWNGGV